MQEPPKVFISYSWSNPFHEEWVINLAQRLVADGVEIVLDKWDLREGHDKFKFMESMVNSNEIKKVIVILDKKYTEKANDRSGGVGTETQIISPSIYANAVQEKFLPIVTEKDDNDKPYIPTYLDGRIFIDFTEEGMFEDQYEKLIRNIYEKPAYTKPKLGKVPNYLSEQVVETFRTSTILRSFENQISKHPNRVNSILSDFLDTFFDSLKDFNANTSDRDIHNFGKVIYDNIVAATPLRNDLVLFTEKLLRSNEPFDIEIIIKFFEKLPILKYPMDQRSTWSTAEFDVFRFYIHEIFLLTIAAGLKTERYQFVEELLYSQYLVNDKHNMINEPKTFNAFYNHIDSIKTYYNTTFSSNFHSPMADMIIKRIPDGLTKDQIIDADLIIYYIGLLNGTRWFPLTYIYREHGSIALFDRLVSMRHFEKVKILFNVTTLQEFADKINKLKTDGGNSQGIGYSNAWNHVYPIYDIIKIEKVGTVR